MVAEGPTGSQDPSSADSRFGRIALVVAECSNRLNAGERVDLAAVAAAHPDLAPQLAEALETLEGLRSSPSGRVPQPVVGDYRIVREVGRGGMGVVYEAMQVSLNRRVALKLLPMSLASSPKAVARILHEAKVAARLKHPGICTVYDAGTHDGTPYIAMQFVEGTTLSEKIAAAEHGDAARGAPTAAVAGPEGGAPLPAARADDGAARESSGVDAHRTTASSREARRRIQETLALVEKTARALHVAHEAGFVHRDIKPGNIMVTEEGEPVVLDFGLAVDIDEDERISVSGELLGTPAYMSPEQIAAGRIRVDRRTDIYSLGVTLYEALTGELPFLGPTREATLQKILASDARDPRKINRYIPKDLRVVIDTAIERDQNRRYRTALDFAEDLRRVRELEPILARPAGPVLRARRWVQRNPVVATAALAVFLLLATGLSISLALLARVREEREVALAERDQKVRALTAQEDALRGKDAALKAQEATAKERDIALGSLRQALARSEGLQLVAQASSEVERDPSLSLLLGIEGAERAPGLLASRALLEAMEGLHEERIWSGLSRPSHVCFSPDGRKLLGAFQDGTARIWEADTGKELHVLSGHKRSVIHCAFAPDGKRIVTASDDKTARVWDAASGECVATLAGHSNVVGCVCFSPDGSRVLTGSGDGTARVWDAAIGTPIAVLTGHSGFVRAASFSPDGRRVLTGSADKTARVWDAASGECVATLAGHSNAVGDARFSPDGSRLATCSADNTRLWDPSGAKEAIVLQGSSSSLWLAFSPDGRRLATASEDGTVKIWDASSGEEIRALKASEYWFPTLAFSADGRLLLAAGRDVVRAWDAASLQETWSFTVPSSIMIMGRAFSPDGERVAIASRDGTLRLWKLRGFGVVRSLEGYEGSFASLLWSADGLRVATVSRETSSGYSVRVYGPKVGGEPLLLRGHERRVDSVDISPDGKRLMTASADATIRLWDAGSGALLFAFTKNLEGVEAVRFRPDGEAAVAALGDGTARILDLLGRREIATLEGHEDWVYSAEFSRDGRRVVTASDDGTARVWDAESGKELRSLRGDERSMLFGAFSHDASRVITAGARGTARIWDVASGKELVVLSGHTSWILGASFSPDGRRVLTTSWDGRARVWDAETGSCVAEMVHRREAPIACFSPDGRTVASAADGVVRLWPADPLAAAKALATRPLTPDERDLYHVGSDEERKAHRKAWELEEEWKSLAQTRRAWQSSPEESAPRRTYLWQLLQFARSRCAAVLRKALWDAMAEAPAAVAKSGGAPKGGPPSEAGFGSKDGLGSKDASASKDEAGPEILALLEELRARRSEARKTLLELEEELPHPLVKHQGPSWEVVDLRKLLLPDLASFASIDWAVEAPGALADEGAEWRIFRGKREPSEKLEWTGVDFDDSSWEVGPSGFGTHDNCVTTIEDMLREYTSIYARRAFDIDDPGPRSALLISVYVDDACVVYVNGAEVGRARAGDPEVRVPFDAVSPEGAFGDFPDVFRVDPSFLRRGKNVVAIHGLNMDRIRGFFIIPLVGRETPAGGEEDSRRFDGFRGAAEGEDAWARIAYLEGRLLQRAGKNAEAAERFEQVLRGWRKGAEPAVRLAEALRALGRSAEARSKLREFLEGGGEPRDEVWDLWYRLGAGDLKATAAELLAAWPAAAVRIPAETGLRWALEEIGGAGALRIDCGGLAHADARGAVWGQDRFFLSGYMFGGPDAGLGTASSEAIAATEEDLVYQTERSFDRADRALSRYRIPVPNGRYDAVLRFAEVESKDPGRRIFGVYLEGAKVLERCEPRKAGFATASDWGFKDVAVSDGFLDVEFGRIRGRPAISGIEVFAQGLLEYRALDGALHASLDAPAVVIARGAEWRFFRGRAEPSAALEWTTLEFDDGAWERGPSGFGYGHGDVATVLDDMPKKYTVLYVRRAFDVGDPAAFGRLVLVVRADDGFVAYLNGVELGRYFAGDPGTRIAFDGVATEAIADPAPLPHRLPVEAKLLRKGRNVLALQGLNDSPRSPGFALLPVLQDEQPPGAATDPARAAPVRAAAAKEASGRSLLYVEARLRQRAGDLAGARVEFEKLLERDPLRDEPLLRWAEAVRGLGETARAEARLGEALRGNVLRGRALWNLWFAISTVDLKRDAGACLEAFPVGAAAGSYGADLRWALESLKASGAIRIHCGGDDYTSRAGERWGRDRFFRGGHYLFETSLGPGHVYQGPIEGTEDDPLYQTERWFGTEDPEGSGYTIPIPPGAYRVGLHFSEVVGSRVGRRFDVSLEGARVLERYAPLAAGFATAEVKSFETEVSDGFLDVDFALRSGPAGPKIAAIEVVRLR